MPGYLVSPVEPPRGGIVCPHCKLVLRDAVQTTGDGHRLCESCYKEICSLPNRTCADCGISLGPEESFYPDRAVRRDVLQTNVRCSYHTSGCVWVGQLQNMEDHCRQCRYQPVCCPNEGCGQLLVPDELDKHIDEECLYRRVRCEHCGRQECANALKEHYSVCPKFPIECGLCQERVSRERLDHHQQHSCTCPVGACGQKLLWVFPYTDTFEYLSRLDRLFLHIQSLSIAVRAQTEEHQLKLKRFSEEIEQLQQQVRTVERQNKDIQRSHQQSAYGDWTAGSRTATHVKCYVCSFSGSPSEVQEHEATRECQGPKPFPTNESSIGPCQPANAWAVKLMWLLSNFKTRISQGGCPVQKVLMEAVRDLDTLEASMRRESSEEGELLGIICGIRTDIRQLQMDTTVTPTVPPLAELLQAFQRKLKDHLQKVKHLHMPRQQTAQHTQEPGGTQSTPLAARGDHAARERVVGLVRRMEELERQTSLMKVHVSELELQLQASLASTHNGSFLWRIPDVSRRKRDAIDERITSIYSPPFYTGHNGYKMCVRAYLNGDGIGYVTHLSIFFVLMKGEYDALLKWPFDHQVSLILVDQNHRRHIVQTFKPSAESSSFKRPQSDMNIASGCPKFAKLTVLDDKNYVKDDVMFVKCIVDTSKVLHP